MTESLEVPKEIQELFEEVKACEACRDVCITSLFRAKRAIYYSKQAVQAKAKGWRLVVDMWPQTANGTWMYSFETGKVHRKDQK